MKHVMMPEGFAPPPAIPSKRHCHYVLETEAQGEESYTVVFIFLAQIAGHFAGPRIYNKL